MGLGSEILGLGVLLLLLVLLLHLETVMLPPPLRKYFYLHD